MWPLGRGLEPPQPGRCWTPGGGRGCQPVPRDGRGRGLQGLRMGAPTSLALLPSQLPWLVGCGCPSGAAWGRAGSVLGNVCLLALGKGISWKLGKVSKSWSVCCGSYSVSSTEAGGEPLREEEPGGLSRDWRAARPPSSPASYRSSPARSGCQETGGCQLRVTSAFPALPRPHLHQLEPRKRIGPVFPESPFLLSNRTE